MGGRSTRRPIGRVVALMARVKAYIAPLNVGEVSKTALARVDIQRVQGAAALQENIIALTEGAMRFRPGSVYTGSQTRNNLKARLIPFSISGTETAMLEMTDLAMRVFVGDVPVTRAAVATTWSNPTIVSSLAPWVAVVDAGCTITVDPGGGALMTSTRLGRCRLTRTATIASVGLEHAFRIKVQQHSIRLRAGTTVNNDDIIAQTVLLPGEHSIACIPTAATIYFTIDALDVGVSIVKEFSLEPAGVVELATVWSEAILPSLRVDQSADVMFVAFGTGPQKRIERRSLRTWSITEYQTDDGPFTSERPSKVFIKPSGKSGTVTLTANTPIFNATSVGQLMEIYHGRQSNYEYVYREGHATPATKIVGFAGQRDFKITATGLTGTGTKITLTRSSDRFGRYNTIASIFTFTADGTSATPVNDLLDGRELYYRMEILPGDYSTGSPLMGIDTASGSQRGILRILSIASDVVANAEVILPLGDTGETEDWRYGDWSSLRGWPAAVALHDGRLFWKRKDSYFGSVSDDYSSFDQEVVGDSGPVLRRSGTGPVEGSLWLLSLQRLIDGSASVIRSIRSSSFDAPLTPQNFLARDIDSRGSAPLSPVKMDSTAIYMSRDFRRAMEIAYNVDISDYSVKNLTRLSRDIFKGVTVTGMAAQRHPDTRVWFVCSDGTARILSYDREEEVFAWQRWRTDGIIEDACARPTDKGSVMYLAVQRQIGGVPQRFIERVAMDDDASGALTSIMSDCSVIYNGAPVSQITGLSHLEGKSVVVWADGKVVADVNDPLTVSGGKVILPYAVSQAVVGLGYTGKWKGSKLAFGGRMGTSVSQRKQNNALSILLSDTAIGGIRIGPDFNRMTRLEEIVAGKPIDTKSIVDEYDIDPLLLPAWANPDARVHMMMISPYPVTVSGVMLDVLTHES